MTESAGERLRVRDRLPLSSAASGFFLIATSWLLMTVKGSNPAYPSLYDEWGAGTVAAMTIGATFTFEVVSAQRDIWRLVPTIPLRYVSHGWGWPLVVVQCWVTGLIWGLVGMGLAAGSVFSLDNVATGFTWTALLWGPAMLILPGELPDAGRDAWSARLRRAPESWDQFCRETHQKEEERTRQKEARREAKRGSRPADPPPPEPSPEPMGVAEAVAFFDLKLGYTRADVKASYRRLSLRWHPDTGIPDDRMMRRINAANALLVGTL